MRRFITTAWIVAAFAAVGAFAQVPRTFVSSTGNDANPCNRTLPCRNFQAAIAAVGFAGEVVALDSAGYGPFTVDKTVTVTADGVHAAITAALTGATSGITINTASSTDIVILRNLAILGPPGASGLEGVNVSNKPIGMLSIENCSISGFQNGVFFAPSTNSALHVRNSVVRSMKTNGVLSQPQTGVNVTLTVENCTFDAVVNSAVRAAFATNGVVIRSKASGNTSAISGAMHAQGGAVLTVVDSVVTGNQIAVISVGTGTEVRIGDSTIMNNATGLDAAGGGAIVSLSGNRLTNNTTDGAFGTTITAR